MIATSLTTHRPEALRGLLVLMAIWLRFFTLVLVGDAWAVDFDRNLAAFFSYCFWWPMPTLQANNGVGWAPPTPRILHEQQCS